MPTVADVLVHAQFLVSKGRGAEAAKLVLPRLENQRRKANREKLTRVQFNCDPQTYADFHGELGRYIEACGGHVPIAHSIIIRLLRQLPTESIKALSEDHEG